MRVADMMRSDLKTVSPDTPVTEIVHTMTDFHVSGLPVVGADGRMLGVVSVADVLEVAAGRDGERARSELFENTTARDLMTAKPVTIQPEADVREAAERMLHAEVKRLFVEDDSRLVGVVSQTDIAYAVGTGRL